MIDKNTYIPFSRRNGIISLPEKETVKDFPDYILAAIRNQSYGFFENVLHGLYINHVTDFHAIKKHIWCYYFNRDLKELENRSGDIIFILEWLADSLHNIRLQWFHKLDILELYINLLNDLLIQDVKDFEKEKFHKAHTEFHKWIGNLNDEFARLHYAYRIVSLQIVEITSPIEIEAVEAAINEGKDSVSTHLMTALQHYSHKLNPNYRNSIKESISAVEVICREITGKDTLGASLNELEKKGIAFNSQLKTGFNNLYNYTNNKDTGIRHALMDDSHIPEQKEALFMLVSCSAFINYLRAIKTKIDSNN
ncbi:AbiJ-NTD4 domain-containing protein [Bacteroides acidifaciens]|uniref:AbiJ-NTD4 domain-containing protein n=1 Tax=Bacteroides acidifaciens TaxID=85831 RepID=UPI0026242F1F|nr:hypothetical protein [Bacteroides acidifaciens]